ncbi:Lhr-like helicase [Mycobacteroides abscessus subsp. abscessus]|nr:Lhr-like helicase [Mycobacteroides abscessus subsp. abscessus]
MSALSPQRERELSGRWSRVSSYLSEEPLEPTVRAVALAQLMLDRYGVLTRGAVQQEDSPGGFAAVYQILTAQEDQGEARRGYFIEGLGAHSAGAGAGRHGSRPAVRCGAVLAGSDPRGVAAARGERREPGVGS